MREWLNVVFKVLLSALFAVAIVGMMTLIVQRIIDVGRRESIDKIQAETRRMPYPIVIKNVVAIRPGQVERGPYTDQYYRDIFIFTKGNTETQITLISDRDEALSLPDEDP